MKGQYMGFKVLNPMIKVFCSIALANIILMAGDGAALFIKNTQLF
jgi:hypothetical protein